MTQQLTIEFIETGDIDSDKRRLKILLKSARKTPGNDLLSLAIMKTKKAEAIVVDFSEGLSFDPKWLEELPTRGYNVSVVDYDKLPEVFEPEESTVKYEKKIDPDDF